MIYLEGYNYAISFYKVSAQKYFMDYPTLTFLLLNKSFFVDFNTKKIKDISTNLSSIRKVVLPLLQTDHLSYFPAKLPKILVCYHVT